MSNFLFKFAETAALVIILQIASISIYAQTRPLPYRFLIPEGYVGWIRVDFNVPDAPQLPVEDGFYIFKFPETGRLQTSSGDVVESRRNEFLYYSAEGSYRLKVVGPIEKRMVHGEFSGPGQGHIAPVPNHYRYIFIGPTDVFDRYQASDQRLGPHESDGYPKVGAQSWLTRDDLIRMSR